MPAGQIIEIQDLEQMNREYIQLSAKSVLLFCPARPTPADFYYTQTAVLLRLNGRQVENRRRKDYIFYSDGLLQYKGKIYQNRKKYWLVLYRLMPDRNDTQSIFLIPHDTSDQLE